MKVTIFGLGLHGGGLSAAHYFASSGENVTVTDLRDMQTLAPAVQSLSGYPNVTFVLGYHRKEDFLNADLVIKNTAVSWDHPMLGISRNIETDLSWFLQHTARPIAAVTGTKGKTTASMLIEHIMAPDAEAAGNMGRSLFPLCESSSRSPVILELSSWQLRDLRMLGKPITPDVSMLTSLFPDHMNSYASFSEYARDKSYLFEHHPKHAVVPSGMTGHIQLHGAHQVWHYGPSIKESGITLDKENWLLLDQRGTAEEIIPAPSLPFGVSGQIAMGALLCSRLLGCPADTAQQRISSFPGVPHRMQLLGESRGIRWINDSASTVPEAVLYALEFLEDEPVQLITGGTDKGLSPDLFVKVFKKVQGIHFLAGSFTNVVMKHCRQSFYGPFTSMDDAVNSAFNTALGSGGVVLMSPGASSFEYFLHEFDRGQQFVNAVRNLDPSLPGRG